MIVKTPKDIGALIRDARRRAKVSQVELARRVGSTQGWISEVENGKATAEIGKVLKVLVALGVTLDAQEAPVAAPSKPEPKVAVPVKPQPASSGIPYDVNDVLKQKAAGITGLAGYGAHDDVLKAAGQSNSMLGRSYDEAMKAAGITGLAGYGAHDDVLKAAGLSRGIGGQTNDYLDILKKWGGGF